MQLESKKRFGFSLDNKRKDPRPASRPLVQLPSEKVPIQKDFVSNINAIISNVKRKRQSSQNVIDLRREKQLFGIDSKKINYQSSVPTILQSIGIGKTAKPTGNPTPLKNPPTADRKYEKKSQSTSSLKSKGPSKIDQLFNKVPRTMTRGSSLNIKAEPKRLKEDENVATTDSNQATESAKQIRPFQRKFTPGSELAAGFKPTINLNSNFFKATRSKQLGFAKLSNKDRPTGGTGTEESGKSEKKADVELNTYVTKFKEFKGLSQYSLTQPKVKQKVTSALSNKFPQRRPYFFDEFVAAHVTDTNDNYFYQLHKVCMTQTIQSLKILGQINMKTYAPSGIVVTLPPPLPLASEPPYSPVSGQTRKTIIFDLDETLIHCNEDQNGPCDLRVPVIFPTGEKIMAGINIRPHSKEVLEELATHFEIVIFTASHSCYANPVVDYFDEKKIISARLFRENCSQVAEGLYTKDLSVIRNRDLKNVVLVDNAVYSFILNLNNGIPIIPYYNNKKDTELLKLRDFLLELKQLDDVRPYVGKYFEWETFLRHCNEPEVLYRRLFES